jgi:F-box protein, helicase, 18
LEFVDIETAHSLAYKHTIRKYGYEVRQSYKTDEIVQILNIQSNQRHAEFILANHIYKFVTYFCNSDKKRVDELIPITNII